MEYTKTNKYKAEKTTCGEVVKILEESNGDIFCMGNKKWIESNNNEPLKFINSWDWLQSQRKNKKIYILTWTDTEYKLK